MIDDAKMWSWAHIVAEELLKQVAETALVSESDVHYVVMCAYVEGIKDAEKLSKSAD